MPKKKKTHEEFVQQVYELVGDAYEVLGVYKDSHSKIELKHIECGTQYEASPTKILGTKNKKGTRCPVCSAKKSNLKRTKTQKEFIQEIYDLVGDKYEVVGIYKNANTKVELVHKECGYTWSVAPNSFTSNGSRCPHCNGGIKLSHEQFLEKVYEKHGKEKYTFLEDYVNSDTKIKIRHNFCQYEFKIEPNSLIIRNCCPKCNKKIRKTTSSFKQEVYDLEKKRFEVIGEYENYHTKISMKHNECGRLFEITPASFLNKENKIKCTHCKYESSSKKLRKTHEEFVAQVKELVGDKFTVEGQYVNSDAKIELRSNECGHSFSITPYNFLNRKRCSICNINVKKTPKQFVKEVYDLVKNEYTVLSDYVNSQSKIRLKHNVCGRVFTIHSGSFLSGTRCSPCARKVNFDKQRHTDEQFKKEIYEIYGDEYTVLEDYININTPILVKHNPCGHEWKTRPSNLKNKKQCPKCRRGLQRTTQIFKNEVFEAVGVEYTILGEFKGIHNGILTRHNVCGHEWNPTPANFFHGGKRCPFCKASKGENVIFDWLSVHGFNFEREYKIEDCRNVNALPFDFVVFNSNGSVSLIEYQGQQHYKPIEFFGGEKALKEVQIRDKIKKEYCNKNNIPLLIIPYWEFDNIEKILNKTLLSI